jgi:hypothetical protein
MSKAMFAAIAVIGVMTLSIATQAPRPLPMPGAPGLSGR